MQLTEKQIIAFDFFTDPVVKVIGYGGAAGGGKSILGCYSLLILCSCLHGSKWFIGRDRLKDTRESVLFTWKKISKILEIRGWKYKDNHIYFQNGSEIEFLDLSYYPQADPLYERLGSKEYTGGWIEEAGSVHPMAFEILKTRIGRWYNNEFGMIGKILVTFNPKKGWLDSTFYRPWKNNQETKEIRFIPALWKDNCHLDSSYIENLKNIKDKSTRERLCNGNFDYDDDPSSLIDYEKIMAIWHNHHVDHRLQESCYLTADIARYGKDWTRIFVWKGHRVIDYLCFAKNNLRDVQAAILMFRIKYVIPVTRCIADEDGVGGGVVDNCGIIGFVNNSKPMDKAYLNLKTECAYKLAEMIDSIHFEASVSDMDKAHIEEELSMLKTYRADVDGKLRILPTEKIKEQIGRSPDWLVNFIFRMYWDVYRPEHITDAYKKALKYFS